MIPIKADRPIKYESSGRALSPELVETFFRFGFAPEERKYKILFLFIAGTGLRVGEAVALNIKDFEPNTNFTEVWVNIEKKKSNNLIVKRIIPESIASILRSWIRDRFSWIASKDGYVFPRSNGPGHITPFNVRDFLCKKRKDLAVRFPGLGFDSVIGNVVLKKPHGYDHSRKQKLYKFCTHSFRHFFAVNIDKRPEIAMRILRHENIETTLKYRNEYDLMGVERKLVNELFDKEFFDAVNDSDENVVAVWNKEFEK